MSTSEQFVADLYLSSLRELIEHYSGMSVRLFAGKTRLSGEQYSTIVGFCEEQIAGSSVLASTPESIRNLADHDSTDPLDWLGELNNQVIGRLKNKLLRHRVTLHHDLPVLMYDVADVIIPTHDSVTFWTVEWDTFRLVSYLSVSLKSDIRFTEVNMESAAVLEGSLLLFE